jgi:predicted Zn-ribbon and HTH transcriptional regulator
MVGPLNVTPRSADKNPDRRHDEADKNMGEYTTFVCRDCGYTAERVRWGVSVTDPRVRFMPAYCVECGAIVEVDLTGADLIVDEFTCVKCGCELFFLDKAQSYTCPKCKAHDMKMEQGEYW